VRIRIHQIYRCRKSNTSLPLQGLKRYLDGLRKGYQQKITEENEIKLKLDMEDISR
jgi:hypothetical protein